MAMQGKARHARHGKARQGEQGKTSKAMQRNARQCKAMGYNHVLRLGSARWARIICELLFEIEIVKG